MREALVLAMMVGAARVRNLVTETLDEVGLRARGAGTAGPEG